MNIFNKLATLFTCIVLIMSVASGCAAGVQQETAQPEAEKMQTSAEAEKTETPADAEKTQTPTDAEQPEAPQTEAKTVNVYALKGPTALGMLGLMDNNEQGNTENKYNITIVGSPDEIVAALSTGEADVAAAPTNLAAKLYAKNSGQKIVAVNTLGILYVLDSTGEIDSVADLAGKTIYATGQGAVPEYALSYILEQAGIADSVTVEYTGEHSALAALAASGDAPICMLPEPFVTTVLGKNTDFKIALDITEEWEAASGNGSVLSMGCWVASDSFINERKSQLDIFLSEYKQSVAYVNENADKAGELAAKFDIIPNAAQAAAAIPNCNIVYIDGGDIQESLQPFFEVLLERDPSSVGGKIPDDSFYYKK